MTSSGKVSILFVDDEPNILQTIRRWTLFSGMDWDARFARSGEEALAELKAKPADLVISDMRMPEMNGAQLFAHIRDRHPDTGRIILSGHSDKEHILRAFSVTHGFLGKPINMTTLKERIDDFIEYRGIIDKPSLRIAASGFCRMPVTKRALDALGAALSASGGVKDVDAIAEIAESDVFLTAKIFHLYHFLFPDDSEKATSLHRVLAALSHDAIQSLVTDGHFFLPYPAENRCTPFLERVTQHCRDVARLAGEVAFAATGDRAVAESAYEAGLFHDIGNAVFLDCLDFGSLLQNAEDIECYPKHEMVGAYLFGLWGFPSAVVWGVGFHHEPRLAPSGDYAAIAAAVHVADHLTRKGASDLDWGLLEELGWVKDMRRRWIPGLTESASQ